MINSVDNAFSEVVMSSNDSANSRSFSERRPSDSPSPKQSFSEDRLFEEEFVRTSRIPKGQNVVAREKLFASIPIPPISRRSIQGVLVRFFRNGDGHHPGVQVAVNEFELKSWEAFLNYLNRQPKLTLRSGGIKHIYTINGNEIRSMTKFQNRQNYVVASGAFIKTKFQHLNDIFNDEIETTKQRVNDQLFVIPYSRLNVFETMIFNRNLSTTFDRWLNENVSDLLSRFNGSKPVEHLYSVTKFQLNEIKSFSQLFNTLKFTDTFIACTEDEFEHSKSYLTSMRPTDVFLSQIRPGKFISKTIDEAKLTLNWIYGYDGNADRSKRILTISDDEILYVIGSIVVILNPIEKRQRFYTKHLNSIGCLNVHEGQPLVASSEKINSKVSIQIWNHQKAELVVELRRDQFGSDVYLLNFSSRIDENFLLVVSKDKPKLLLIVDWKRNEIVHSISTKSDRILSASFIFHRTDWITCISNQHVLFYQINLKSKPVRLVTQREGEVQNIYTGAVTSDRLGERLIIGDKVGSLHVFRFVNDEPKLTMTKEQILESDVQFVQSINAEQLVFANGQNQMKIWNFVSNQIDEIRLEEKFGTIQSITSFREGFIIGTRLNFLLLYSNNNIEILLRGHTNSIVSLCHQKSNSTFFSISSDRFLFKWNSETKSVEWTIKCPQLISSADLHPERNIIILGTETSKLLIYDTLSSFYVTTIVLNVNSGVKAVRFSPNGFFLAVGLQNGQICLFDVLGNGDFRLRLEEKSNSNDENRPVIDVIWSSDSKWLLVVFDENRHELWSVPNWSLNKGKTLQSISWPKSTHPLTCPQFDQSIVESHSSAIVLSANLILCCGKDGQIRLFRNHHERNFQSFQVGLGPVQSVVPSSNKSLFYISIVSRSTIVELELNLEKNLR